MQTFSHTLSTLTVIDGQVLCQDGTLFDRVAYSHFKYGFLPPAVQYGQQLAALIADQLFEVAGTEPITIVSAPYKYLPTASHAVAQAITAELSHKAVMNGQEPPVLVPFFKSRVGSSNYAKSSEEYRQKSLATLGLRIDKSRVRGAHVVVVDDIRITGSAEKATAQYLESLQPASIWYLHAARLEELLGIAYPGLEDELNQTVAHTPEVILQQVAAGEFQLNTRILRLILETENYASFDWFVSAAPRHLLESIHQAALGNGPAYYEKYRTNLELVHFQLGLLDPRSVFS
ncbi:MAG TPA: phosphoribosyltransferase family protein [Candidatus Microsaccharimonas sp.]